jgi:hypothetical protein
MQATFARLVSLTDDLAGIVGNCHNVMVMANWLAILNKQVGQGGVSGSHLPPPQLTQAVSYAN